tara:strand:+ start:15583 stop:15771 length:189 start_codon:yes stop_codon:yes gene_type:complete
MNSENEITKDDLVDLIVLINKKMIELNNETIDENLIKSQIKKWQRIKNELIKDYIHLNLEIN